MKKLFKSHPRHPHHQQQQQQQQQQDEDREPGPRAISPFTLVHNVNDPTSPDAQLQQYAQQQQALYQQHPVHARERDRERDRERERDNVGRGYRNSVAAYPSTDDITSWELVAGQHPYRQRQQQQQPPPLNNDRDRSPSVASLSTSNTTLPNPFSPQPHPSTPPYTHQQPFSASRTSSLNSLLPGAPQSSPRTTSAPLLAQNHPPNPPGSAGSYAPSPISPAAGAGLPGSGGTTGPAGASTGAAGGVGGGVLRKKNANSNNIQSPIHTASLQLAQHQLPQASVPPPPQASTAAILRALDSSMLGAMSPTASSQHQHKTGSGLVSRTSIRSAHRDRDRDREPREIHHPQPQSQPQAHLQQLHALHTHLRVPVLSSRKEKSQQGTRQHQQQYPQQQQYQESQHRNRSHSLSDIEFGANEGVSSDFDDESGMRRSSEVDPELERDSLELERQARWRERDLEIEGKAVPRKGGGEKDKDRDSKGFFERLQQLGDSGDSKREGGGGVGKDERGTEKERKDKKEKAQFLTNIFSTGKDRDKDKDRSKSKKDFDTTVDPLTLPPSQHHPPQAPPRLDISAPVPLHANQPQPLPIHSYNNMPPPILPAHDLAYHSTPAINAAMISSSQALSQSGGADPLARMVGLFVSPSQEGIDWALAFELCEQTKGKERKDGKEGRDVKDGEANAKSIAKALRKELKYARPSEQLGAVSLWAVMLQNASDFFITQTSSRKFLDVVEDVILHTRSLVIRDRLIEVLGAAAYLANQKGGKDTSKRENFKVVWRKLKPETLPDEGMPLSMDNPMFHPQPVISHLDGEGDRHRVIPLRPPMSERRSSRNGIIPVDEDIRRLSQECTIGRGNAQLLDEALAFATPDDLKEKDIIKEFYAKCRASQDLIQAQIPWASAGAERSRMRQLETLGPEALRNGDELPSTQEEKLLADLLLANEELAEVLRIYGDIERIGIESEAERQAWERSKVEIRATSIDHQLSGEASSFLAAPSLAPSSSRSQSPSSFLMNSQTSHLSNLPPPSSDKHTAADTMPLSAAALYHQHFAQLQSSSQQHLSGSDSSHSFNTHGHSHNQGHLAPAPNRPLHGPRSPPPSGAAAAAAAVAAAVAGAGVHSRTSSPINASRPNSIVHSRAASVDTSLGSSIDASTTAVAANPKIERETSDQTVLRSATVVQNDPGRPESTELPTLSEKAAGKRRMAEEDLRAGSLGTPNGDAHAHLEDLHSEFRSSEPDVNNTDLDNDPDNDSDRDRDRWKPKIHYAYDAAAERTKERMLELAVGGMG
ncbi:hypothetical protein ACEPAI_2378 [Sanghuangporus weigelae]